MPRIFAHHNMLEGLDALGLNPVTPLDHALAFGIYALITFVVAAGLTWAGQRLLGRHRGRREVARPMLGQSAQTLEA